VKKELVASEALKRQPVFKDPKLSEAQLVKHIKASLTSAEKYQKGADEADCPGRC
jgi:hypothetical protein